MGADDSVVLGFATWNGGGWIKDSYYVPQTWLSTNSNYMKLVCYNSIMPICTAPGIHSLQPSEYSTPHL
jgi:uncharacterized membrane protein YeiH